MAKSFSLNANVVLKGPVNVRPVVNSIKKQLNFSSNVNVQISKQSQGQVNSLTKSFKSLTKEIQQTNASVRALNANLSTLGKTLSSLNMSNITTAANAMSKVSKNTKTATNVMYEFGHAGGLAFRRFTAFSLATAPFVGFISLLGDAVKRVVEFDKQMIKLSQVSGQSVKQLSGLKNAIFDMATGLGVNSDKLADVAVTLKQAGLSARDTRVAMEALAEASLAPSFNDMTETTEGAIAAMAQFGIKATDLKSVLGSVNAVSQDFAVEAEDIIKAIRIAGGVFASTSKGVSEGKDALNEFMAAFTAVRATTRASAESIATGFNTIFARIQRPQTIQFLKKFGIELKDLNGRFVGPYEGIKRISEGLKGLDSRDLAFAKIVEELGGFRQLKNVIPLFGEIEKRNQALATAQQGTGSTAQAAIIAQQSLANQFTKTRESFQKLIQSISETTTFRTMVTMMLDVANAAIKMADAIKPLIPFLGMLVAFKGARFLAGAIPGVIGGLKGKKFADGGPVHHFANGGMVPGTGNTDSVRTRLMPGEFVLRKKAVADIGAHKLMRMNKGGPVKMSEGGGAGGHYVVSSDNVGFSPKIVQELLAKLPAGVKTNFVIGLAGSGKSTLTRKFGQPLLNPADAMKASELTFESASTKLENILPLINRTHSTGGFGIALDKAADVITAQRNKRVEDKLAGLHPDFDKRSPEALKATHHAPLGFAPGFLDGLKAAFPKLQVQKFAAGGLAGLNPKIVGGVAMDPFNAPGQGKDFGVTIDLKDLGITNEDRAIEPNVDKLVKRGKVVADIKKNKYGKLLDGIGYDKLGMGDGKDLSFRFIASNLSSTKHQAVLDSMYGGAAIGMQHSLEKLGMDNSKVTPQTMESIMSPSQVGHVFENLFLANNKSKLTDANRPIDLTNGLGDMAKLYGDSEVAGLKYIEVKKNLAQFTPGEVSKKITNQLLSEGFDRLLANGDMDALKRMNTNYHDPSLKGRDKSSATSIVGERLNKIFPKKMAAGGESDGSIPALVMPGEYIFKQDAVNRIGLNNLNRMNKTGELPKYHSGGLVHMKKGGSAPSINYAPDGSLSSGYKRGRNINIDADLLTQQQKTRLAIAYSTKYGMSLKDATEALKDHNYKIQRVNKLTGNITTIYGTQEKALKELNRGYTSMSRKMGRSVRGGASSSMGRFGAAAGIAYGAESYIGRGTANRGALSGALTGAAGGAATGAELGAMLGPKGMAIGAALGTIGGGVAGMMSGHKEGSEAEKAIKAEKALELFDKGMAGANSELDKFNSSGNLADLDSAVLQLASSMQHKAAIFQNQEFAASGQKGGFWNLFGGSFSSLFADFGTILEAKASDAFTGAAIGARLGGAKGALGGGVVSLIGGIIGDYYDGSLVGQISRNQAGREGANRAKNDALVSQNVNSRVADEAPFRQALFNSLLNDTKKFDSLTSGELDILGGDTDAGKRAKEFEAKASIEQDPATKAAYERSAVYAKGAARTEAKASFMASAEMKKKLEDLGSAVEEVSADFNKFSQIIDKASTYLTDIRNINSASLSALSGNSELVNTRRSVQNMFENPLAYSEAEASGAMAASGVDMNNPIMKGINDAMSASTRLNSREYKDAWKELKQDFAGDARDPNNKSKLQASTDKVADILFKDNQALKDKFKATIDQATSERDLNKQIITPEDLRKQMNDVVKDMTKEQLDAAKKYFGTLENVNDQFLKDLSQVNVFKTQAVEKTLAGLSIKNSGTDLLNSVTGRDMSFAEARARDEEVAMTRGGAAGADVGKLSNQYAALLKRRADLQNKQASAKMGSEEQKQFGEELQQTTFELSETKAALESLTQASNVAAVAQAKMGKLTASTDAIKNFFKRGVTGNREDRRQQMFELQAAKVLMATKQLTNDPNLNAAGLKGIEDAMDMMQGVDDASYQNLKAKYGEIAYGAAYRASVEDDRVNNGGVASPLTKGLENAVKGPEFSGTGKAIQREINDSVKKQTQANEYLKSISELLAAQALDQTLATFLAGIKILFAAVPPAAPPPPPQAANRWGGVIHASGGFPEKHRPIAYRPNGRDTVNAFVPNGQMLKVGVGERIMKQEVANNPAYAAILDMMDNNTLHARNGINLEETTFKKRLIDSRNSITDRMRKKFHAQDTTRKPLDYGKVYDYYGPIPAKPKLSSYVQSQLKTVPGRANVAGVDDGKEHDTDLGKGVYGRWDDNAGGWQKENAAEAARRLKSRRQDAIDAEAARARRNVAPVAAAAPAAPVVAPPVAAAKTPASTVSTPVEAKGAGPIGGVGGQGGDMTQLKDFNTQFATHVNTLGTNFDKFCACVTRFEASVVMLQALNGLTVNHKFEAVPVNLSIVNETAFGDSLINSVSKKIESLVAAAVAANKTPPVDPEEKVAKGRKSVFKP